MKKGFTLIELLIVVAIIAILAAIAVPNFLDAQVRSKVSRAKTDMRTVEIALESYRIDCNKYPGWFGKKPWLWTITTPLAYMSAIPQDPFQPIRRDDNWAGLWKPGEKGYLYFGQDVFGPTNASATQYGLRWVLQSLGPDKGCIDNAFAGATPGKNFLNMTTKDGSPPYDPSNGTVSRGNIARWGPGNIPAEQLWAAQLIAYLTLNPQ